MSYSQETEIYNYKKVKCRHNSMMSRHFRLKSEPIGARAKKLPTAKNRFSVTGSSLINSLQIYIYTCEYIYTYYTHTTYHTH